MLVKKAGARVRKREELKEAVEALAQDMHKLRKHLKMAERAMSENLFDTSVSDFSSCLKSEKCSFLSLTG